MPANSNFARNNRLTRCNFWDDAEQVLPRGLECTKDPPKGVFARGARAGRSDNVVLVFHRWAIAR